MKAFLEEYGLIITAVLVILAIIGFATPLGEMVVKGISGVIDKFMTEAGITAGTLPGGSGG